MKSSVKNLLILAMLLGTSNAWAQKIDQRLTKLVEQTSKSRGIAEDPVDLKVAQKQIAINMNADGTINSLSAIAILKKDAECPTEKLEQMGIKVRYVLGDMVALVIPTDKLMALEDIEEFRSVRADQLSHLMNEEARKATGVEQVNTEESAKAQSLPKAYTGSGVVVGIIDCGIDFNHAAFRNADGTTRIKRAWEINTKKDYTEDEIKTLTTDDLGLSHGSHTSATAAGSITGNGQQGMAPQADLYLCGGGAKFPETDVVECMSKIFKYAEEVGKPAVINLSMGDVLGLHDGSYAYAKAAATLTNNGTAKGRVVVVSSANSAATYQSIVKTLHTNTLVAGEWQLATVLGSASYPTDLMPDIPVSYFNSAYCIYASDHKDFEVKLALVDVTNGKIMEIGNHALDDKSQPLTVDKILQKDSKVPALDGTDAVMYKISFKEQRVTLDLAYYRLALFIKGNSDGQVIKMICDGDNNAEPCFDAPTDGGYDFRAAGYTKGNGDIACNVAACNDYVISVGAYITRTGYKNYAGKDINYTPSTLTGKLQELGEISDFSSYGIDDNGKPRPTIIAPGQGLISAVNNYDTNYFSKEQIGVALTESTGYATLIDKLELHNRNNWYAISEGTSMSAPVVTGIMALWLQANPNLTSNEIMDILKETCKNDEYTTDVSKIPSGNKIQAGLGKIDCVAGLKKILNTTGIETVAADERREATPATMYSVDAPVYNMMGQRVGKSQKGIVIYKGRKYVNR